MAVTKTAKTNELIEKIKKGITEEENIKVMNNGTFYMVDKTDYSFNCYFVYNDGVFTKPTVDEIIYDLKNRVYKLYRNEKELNFTEDNLRKSFERMPAEEMEFFEVSGNKGFFTTTREFGAREYEREQMISRQLIRLMEDFPAIEFVYKAGLPIKHFCTKYSTTLRTVNPKATNLLDFYGFQYKAQLKLLREISKAVSERSGQANDLHLMVKEFTIQECDLVRNILNLSYELNHKYGLNKTYDILNLFGFASWYNWRNTRWDRKTGKNVESKIYKEVLENYVFDLNRYIEYVFYEMDVRQANTNYHDYNDYIRMSKEMGGKFDKYPTSIAMAHDIALRYHRMLVDYTSNLTEPFNAAVATLVDYEGTIKGTDYCIVAPKDMSDIIKEGQDLSHCVKSYIPAIAHEETAIVFLRNKQLPEESLYTIEIKDGSVVQARGKFNCDLTDDAKQALSKFADSFLLSETY